jgi:hypothetical protein
MTLYNDFAVEKCGNKDAYFLIDANIAEAVCQNTWTVDSTGYLCRNVRGVLQRLHIFVIETATGKKVPEGMYVDHINKCKTDNRLCNLRIVSPRDSAMNLPLKANNTSGYTGVSHGRNNKGYRAYITVDKKRIELGTFPTIAEAARARYAAEERYGFTHHQNLEAFLVDQEGGNG